MITTGIGTASNTVHLQVNGVGRTVNVAAESSESQAREGGGMSWSVWSNSYTLTGLSGGNNARDHLSGLPAAGQVIAARPFILARSTRAIFAASGGIAPDSSAQSCEPEQQKCKGNAATKRQGTPPVLRRAQQI